MLRQTIADDLSALFYSVAGTVIFIQFHRPYWSIALFRLQSAVCCNDFSWWTDWKCKLYCDVFGVFCTLRSPRIFCQLVHGKMISMRAGGITAKSQ